MEFRDLALIHRLKAEPRDSVRLRSSHVFHLDTCQRQVWLLGSPDIPALPDAQAELYRGESAYEKLLLIACGLESRMLGETEVFGQLRSAWRAQQPAAGVVDTLMQRLFEDTKFVRTEYLKGLGGQSYGTAVRKFLQPGQDARILLVGAGELAASILPIFKHWPIMILNRTREHAEKLVCAHQSSGYNISLCKSPETVSGMTYALVCRPFDAAVDQKLVTLDGLHTLVHLGASSGQIATLAGGKDTRLLSLDDVFAMQSADNETREHQASYARRVCRERARLRRLGSSVSLPHGWEYLPVFG